MYECDRPTWMTMHVQATVLELPEAEQLPRRSMLGKLITEYQKLQVQVDSLKALGGDSEEDSVEESNGELYVENSNEVDLIQAKATNLERMIETLETDMESVMAAPTPASIEASTIKLQETKEVYDDYKVLTPCISATALSFVGI